MSAAVDLLPVPAPLLERLAAMGVDVDAVRRRAGLEVSHLEAPIRLTTREFFAFFEAMDGEASVSRGLGLALGAGALDHDYSLPTIVALHAPTLAGALRTMARYKRLACPEQVEVETAGGEVSIRFHWVLAETNVPRVLVDSTFASFAALAKRGTGTAIVPKRVELARRRSDATLLADHFGCPIRFSAPVDLLVFEERVLALPFVTRDAYALASLVPDLEKALVGKSRMRSFRDDVRLAIARQMCGDRPTVGAVAKRLSLSARTLQRRLEEESTSYQQQLDEVRQKIARRLLTNTDLDPVEVAFVLGFEEPNSFGRAFRSWEGKTPVRWRATEL